jgi:SAM-dependent methyltransferase
VASAEGAATFLVAGEAYDRFMGRYSAPLAVAFADAAGVEAGQTVLDVGCGPGALTAELVKRAGAANVFAVDPSQPFVESCRERNPGVEVELARAEELPHPDGRFDAALAQLVLHFVDDPEASALEMRRVCRSGGLVGACVWASGGMTMLRSFWASARAIVPAAPGEAETRRFGTEGEIADLFRGAGLEQVADGALDVKAGYEDFDDLWTPFLGGVGPAGAFCASLDAETRERLREDLRARLGSPTGPFTLPARAWYATGRGPER